jgi:hypothetical protein
MLQPYGKKLSKCGPQNKVQNLKKVNIVQMVNKKQKLYRRLKNKSLRVLNRLRKLKNCQNFTEFGDTKRK